MPNNLSPKRHPLDSYSGYGKGLTNTQSRYNTTFTLKAKRPKRAKLTHLPLTHLLAAVHDSHRFPPPWILYMVSAHTIPAFLHSLTTPHHHKGLTMHSAMVLRGVQGRRGVTLTRMHAHMHSFLPRDAPRELLTRDTHRRPAPHLAAVTFVRFNCLPYGGFLSVRKV